MPWTVLHSGCQETCKFALQGIAKEDYDSCLASLPIPIWQVRSRPSGGHASVFGKPGWDARRPQLFRWGRLAVFTIARVTSKALVVKAGRHSPLETPPAPSNQLSLQSLSPDRRGKSTCFHGRKAPVFPVSWGWVQWGARRVNTEQLLGRSIYFKGRNSILDCWAGQRFASADFVISTLPLASVSVTEQWFSKYGPQTPGALRDPFKGLRGNNYFIATLWPSLPFSPCTSCTQARVVKNAGTLVPIKAGAPNRIVRVYCVPWLYMPKKALFLKISLMKP